jgi:hypothetical protein
MSELREEVKELRNVLADFVKGSFTATTTLSFSTPSMPAAASIPPLPPFTAAVAAAAAAPDAPTVLSGHPVTPPTPLEQLVQQGTGIVPSYKLSRQIYTIPDLWRMWTVGLGGMASVEELDARWGSGWRQSSAERQYYSMRKVLIDEIKARTAEAGGDWFGVVEDMERKRVLAKASIDKVIKTLKLSRKAGDLSI